MITSFSEWDNMFHTKSKELSQNITLNTHGNFMYCKSGSESTEISVIFFVRNNFCSVPYKISSSDIIMFMEII